MVCSLGCGKMAVMARLLDAGRKSHATVEEDAQQRASVGLAFRELCGADEANLLDEADMDVFGLKPMTDALDLVCCNACKKPVKASQYAAHAELCRSIISTVIATKIDDGIGHRKPPRRKRKKLTAYTNQATSVANESSEAVDANNATASKSHLGTSACIRLTSSLNAEAVNTDKSHQSIHQMPPATRRLKIIHSKQPVRPEPPKASGEMKLASTRDSFTSVPAPLATKVYYSQRNNRLQFAVACMFHASSSNGHFNNAVSPEASQDSMVPLHTSNEISSRVPAEPFNKIETSGHIPSMIPSQRSEACSDKSMDSLPVTNFCNQYPVDNILSPQTATQGSQRSKYISMPYSLPGNSRQQALQPNESVPVT